MGAEFRTEVVKGKLDSRQLERKFKSIIKEHRSYNGHQDGYSGDFQTLNGVELHAKVFPTKDDAEFYLDNTLKKWENAIAVYYKLRDKNSVKLDKLLSRRDVEIKAKRELDHKLHKEVREAKSLTIGCKKCSSKVNRKYVSHAKCPVCGDCLLSATALKRLATQHNKINKLNVAIEEEKKRLASKGPVNTLIGGVCAC